jgi:nucleoside-diphosphate-sugar epimerase
MKKVLVIGGTKYLGLEFINLLINQNIDLFVASRKEICVENFIKIDRKNQDHLNKTFLNNEFDIVIDFINYSGLDSKKLLDSLKLQKYTPKLILISTVYTYMMPLEMQNNSVFDENSFNPLGYKFSLNDRPKITYSEGKRNMESYSTQNYPIDKLVILRFPIILGANDYTRRTHFYLDKIKNKLKINPNKVYNKSGYIFSFEAASSILNFVLNDYYGIYNVSFNSISEFDLITMFCDYYNLNVNLLLSSNIDPINTPFTSNFDFIIDNNKYNSIFPFNLDFKDGLYRELSKIAV